MISVREAQHIVKINSSKGSAVRIPIVDAVNLFLAEDIYAPINVPSFNQSAMDGYAFKYADVESKLTVVGEIPAGDVREVAIEKGQAVRIYTGAKVPDSCDTVVMQELTEVEGNQIKVKDVGLKLGGNIRKEGYQIKKEDLSLKKGAKITPAAVGFLTSLGLTKVQVYNKPTVTIIATGDELVKPGNLLQKGQVYESNTLMLKAALKKLNIDPEIIFLPDNFEQTKLAIKTALEISDLILLSGGISVGDYDFVKQSLEENGVEQLFYKVKQKPGKPLFYGKKRDKIIFALPGNPAAALNCFYIYVLYAINQFIGNPNPGLEQSTAIITQDYQKKSGRAEFLKANINEGKVELLDGQGSDVLLSFAKANCLVYLPNEREQIKAGESVDVYLLPV